MIPIKQGDPGSFLIPCSFETGITYNALADLGAATSVMPLSMCTKVGIELLSCKNMVVQVVDGSCNRPFGIAEDVPVRVGNLVFPAEFMVLDMPEQTDVPLILGRPFLSTAEVIINMPKKVLSLGIGDRRMMFPLAKPIKPLKPCFESFFPCHVIEVIEGERDDSKKGCQIMRISRKESSFRL